MANFVERRRLFIALTLTQKSEINSNKNITYCRRRHHNYHDYGIIIIIIIRNLLSQLH